MITGFNTDIEHEGVTYHVQTEDKGLETPLILSLVYTGGAILASKRSPYDDLIAEGFDEQILTERLQRQHKLICAAIRAGRLEELKKMSGRENSKRRSSKKESSKEPAKESKKESNTGKLKAKSAPLAPETFAAAAPAEDEPASTLPRAGENTAAFEPESAAMLEPESAATHEPDKPKSDNLPPNNPSPAPKTPQSRPPAPMLTEAYVPVATPVRPLPPPPTSPRPRHTPRALRQPARPSVADFVRAETTQNQALHLTLLDEKNYRGGDRVILRVHLAHGPERRQPIGGAEVMVKILGSTFRPLILQSQTGTDGVASFSIQLPHFRSGRAAILVRASIGGHEVELRRIIQQG